MSSERHPEGLQRLFSVCLLLLKDQITLDNSCSMKS